MIIKPIDNDICTTFFMNDPKLCLSGLSDDMLQTMHETGKYPEIDGEEALGIYDGEELIAIVKLGYFTWQALNLHFYLGTRHQKKNKMKGMYKVVEDYIRENKTQRKVVIYTPSSCKHAQNMIQYLGFELEGTIKSSMVWREKLVDLLVFGVLVKENKE